MQGRAIASSLLFEGNSPKNSFLSVIVGLRPTITLKIIYLLGLNWHDAIALVCRSAALAYTSNPVTLY